VDTGRFISFANKHGQILRGLLHEPSGEAIGVCILLLSPGIKGRVGPHRLYLKIAERLTPLGFHVLRFDYHGLGDSDGEISEVALADMYNTVHGGRYVGDTISAMDWMQSESGIRRFIGSGLCGGSISALLTAAEDARIECLLGIGLPTALDGGPENWGKSLTSGQLQELRGSYLRKLLDARSWLRLLTGKTNYSVLWRSLRPKPAAPAPIPKDVVAHPADNANPRFAPAFRQVLESNRPMLLIFSGNDRLHHEFEEKFEARHSDLASQRGSLYQTVVIPQANHVLSDSESVTALLDHAERWLLQRYRPIESGYRAAT
jgi:pimeloyl-ACP methyl ester carboxylesterase